MEEVKLKKKKNNSHNLDDQTHLLFLLMPNFFDSVEPFDTGNDSRFAINKFIDDFNSSTNKDSISLRTNFGINLRFRSISLTLCILPSSSRRMAAACSSDESN